MYEQNAAKNRDKVCSVGPLTSKNSMKNELILETDDDETGDSKD